MTTNHTIRTLAAATTLLGVLSGAASADLTAADRCIADKTGGMSKYAVCVLKARRGFELTGDAARYAATVAKCATGQSGAFARAETVAGPGGCPVDHDAADIAAFADACFDILVGGIGGATLPADLPACYSDLSTCQADLGTCSGDLATCQASVGVAMLKTGQTICANTSGGLIACAGTGQDGDVLAGLATAYTDNGDGTITDTRTKLTWEKLSNDGSIHDKDNGYLWLNGLAKIATLNAEPFAGHNDWRMPNIRELETLVNFGRDFPTATDAFNTTCNVGCTVLDCSCTNSSDYWSSTTFESDKPCAWAVNFATATRSGLPKATNSFRVRAVRGGL